MAPPGIVCRIFCNMLSYVCIVSGDCFSMLSPCPSWHSQVPLRVSPGSARQPTTFCESTPAPGFSLRVFVHIGVLNDSFLQQWTTQHPLTPNQSLRLGTSQALRQRCLLQLALYSARRQWLLGMDGHALGLESLLAPGSLQLPSQLPYASPFPPVGLASVHWPTRGINGMDWQLHVATAANIVSNKTPLIYMRCNLTYIWKTTW